MPVSVTFLPVHEGAGLKDSLLDAVDFLKIVNDGKHELEFLWEFHRPGNGLYQCWLWKKGHGMEAECQFEIMAKSIEYRWNEILPDREW